MIKFEGVSFAYPGENRILNELSFDIKPGEQVALIGANGAGKSTLLKSILGLLKADGIIVVNGKIVEKKNLADIRKMIGFVLQDSDNQMFMPKVIDDIMFGLVNYGMRPEEARNKAEKITAKLDISHLSDRHNYTLSAGEKRMAAIATVLAMEPKAILLDEPSAALDPANRRKVINTLNNLEVTKIIATHDLDMVLETCDRVLLINKGKIVADGDTWTILNDKELLEANGLELPFSIARVPNRKNR